MFLSYFKLTVAALIPVLATFLLTRLNRSARFGKLSYAKKQLFFGVVFGAIAVLGTEWGIPLEGAVVNCRDAAPLCAGLFFGGMAGVIAGIIGAVERWFAVYWGAGYYTRLACSLATLLAGVIAAGLNKIVFESKRPRLLLSAVCAFLIEALHQSMVFFFHINDAVNAAAIVRVTAPPMLVANTLSVLLAGFFCIPVDGRRSREKKDIPQLSVVIERNLLVLVVLSFLFTTAYAYQLQTSVTEKQAERAMYETLEGLISSDEVRSGRATKDWLNDPAHTAGLGSGGMLLVLDEESGDVVSFSAVTVPEKIVLSPQEKEGQAYSCKFYGEKWFALWRRAGGYVLIAAMPASVVYSVRNISAIATCFVQIFIYGLLFAGIDLMLRKTVVRSIRGMNGTLSGITSGDLDRKVDERGSMEFSQLSDGINATVDTLKSYIAEAKARNERELMVARDIQLSALPRTFPAFPKRRDMDVYALTQPAREVGGDFYDFYFANDGRFYFLIADVSGKGIPAAMFMMRAKTQLKGIIETGGSIEEAFCRGNNALCEGNDAEMFVTAWMAEIDMEAGTASFVNAGHNPPVVSAEDGSFSYLKGKPGFVLAGMEGMRYKKQTLRMRPGSRIILYTDGVTEAVNTQNELFGEERLLALINANAKLSAQALGEKIREEVLAFTGEAEQFDDITVLVFDYIGESPEAELRFTPASAADQPAATEFLEQELRKRGCPERTIQQLDIALDEIFSNILKYAYPDAAGPITLRVGEEAEPHAVVLTFIDEGTPYDPLQAADPDTTLDIDDRTPGGLGFFLVKKMMDEVRYAYEEGRNILRLKKII